MPAPITVSFHQWPWSVDVEEESVPAIGDKVELPFFGSPVLSVIHGTQVLLSARHEKFVPLGPVYKDRPGVYEVPHGVLSQAGRNGGDLTVISGGMRWNLAIEAKGAKRRTRDDGKTESELATMVLSWSQFFDDLMEDKDNRATEIGKIHWGNVLEFLNKQMTELQHPRLSLIVRIAEAMHASLPETVSGMRRILLRERSMQRISRICETDMRCLQWYVRQPGASMAEKGGSRQELMAVVRRESFDVLENRVLKDFVHRCDAESLRYINSEVDVNPRFAGSKRAQEVRCFREICAESRRHQDFNGVHRAETRVRPNYVLQNDMRYRNIWTWYCRLLRREEEEDRFWDWQARTWSDIVRLLVNLAIVSLEKEGVPSKGVHIRQVVGSSLHVAREQVLGSRTCSGSEPGPFVIERFTSGKAQPIAILEVVHPDEAHEHSLAQNLGRTGGHLYLVVRPFKDSPQNSHVLIVWGINTAGTDQNIILEKMSDSASNALKFHKNILLSYRIQNLPLLQGLVVASSLGAKTPDVIREASDAPVVVVPPDNRQWRDVVVYFAILLQDWLEKLL